MRRAIIIHCWEGRPNTRWYPSVKKGLEKKGFEVQVPLMPTPDAPNRETWVSKLTELVGEPDEETYIVGHSSGGPTILRYLESLPEGKKIGGVVLVAGFVDNLGYEELDSFFTEPFGWEKIRSSAGSFVLIHSDNDPFVPLEQADILMKELKAELIVFPGAGHFSHDERCTELPVVIEKILDMSK